MPSPKNQALLGLTASVASTYPVPTPSLSLRRRGEATGVAATQGGQRHAHRAFAKNDRAEETVHAC